MCFFTIFYLPLTPNTDIVLYHVNLPCVYFKLHECNYAFPYMWEREGERQRQREGWVKVRERKREREEGENEEEGKEGRRQGIRKKKTTKWILRITET